MRFSSFLLIVEIFWMNCWNFLKNLCLDDVQHSPSTPSLSSKDRDIHRVFAILWRIQFNYFKRLTLKSEVKRLASVNTKFHNTVFVLVGFEVELRTGCYDLVQSALDTQPGPGFLSRQNHLLRERERESIFFTESRPHFPHISFVHLPYWGETHTLDAPLSVLFLWDISHQV